MISTRVPRNDDASAFNEPDRSSGPLADPELQKRGPKFLNDLFLDVTEKNFLPKAEQRCAWSRKLDPNFEVEPRTLASRLPRTPPFSRLLRHAGGYSRTILA